MKIDFNSILYLSIVFIYVLVAFSFIIYSYKNYVNKYNLNISYSVINGLKYILNISYKNYLVFEKYGIWRYFIHLKSINIFLKILIGGLGNEYYIRRLKVTI